MLDRNKSNLYDWIFHFNTYQNVWMAAKRDNYSALFSEITNKDILKSSNINTLIEIIERTDGNPEKIQQLVK